MLASKVSMRLANTAGSENIKDEKYINLHFLFYMYLVQSISQTKYKKHYKHMCINVSSSIVANYWTGSFFY